MNKKLFQITFLKILFIFLPLFLYSQEGFVVVEKISIEGNKKTKDRIVYRELDFQPGDTLPLNNLGERLEQNKKQILNSGMFSIVKVNVKHWDKSNNNIHILITLTENWYVYPIPIFELADRNFNVWWTEQNRALDRINFGVRFYHINITGQRDLLKVLAQFGYTQKYEVIYTLPAINNTQTIGLSTKILFTRNKETNYTTSENKLVFERAENEFLLQRFIAEAGLIFRPRLFNYHSTKIEYHQNTTSGYLASELNPDFFLNARTRQRFFALHYNFTVDKRDIKPYPLNGRFVNIALRKDGLGVFGERDALTLTTSFAQYVSFSKKFSLEVFLKGHLAGIRKKQPYYNSRALGFFIDFLRGYEFYVVDGLDFAYVKSSFRFELIDKHFNFGKYMFVPQLRIMPIKIYLTLNNDSGYVNDPFYSENNPLSNQLLWGGGLGLDFVFYFDKVLQVEYSFNHLGESGLFLNYKLPF